MNTKNHTLYIVATPIGHRDDLSIRAISVLRAVDRIYAEDTRHSQTLMRHHAIDTPLLSLHEHNEVARVSELVEYLQHTGSAALITDAGTPLISDPGYRIVRGCLQASISVSPIPGASALTAALSVAGLPTDRFLFAGFPPSRSGARQQWLTPLAHISNTLVLYESPHRIVATLTDLLAIMGPERELTLARELTKRFETILHGSTASVLDSLQQDVQQQKGEFVLVIAGKPPEKGDHEANDELDRFLHTMLQHLPVKTAARCAAEWFNMTRKQAYDRALELQHPRD